MVIIKNLNFILLEFLRDNMSDDSVTVVNINEKYVGKEFFDQFQTIRQSEKG